VNFEERVLAAKAKIDEACEELLELVCTSPSAASDICQILNPGARHLPSVKMREFYRTEVSEDGVEGLQTHEIELTPFMYGFERREIDHERHNNALIVKGGVRLLLSLSPEDEMWSQRIRRYQRGEIDEARYLAGSREEM
jgi:hypothetical protein